MIEEIRVRSLGVIDEAVIEPGPGLTVITGETGAGKTMVLTAVSLLLGEKADSANVRNGSLRSEVDGRFIVSADPVLAARLDDAGAVLDDDVLTISRVVSAEGRGRAFVGGRSVPAAVLADVGSRLVAVHGQHDQQRLLKPSRQRSALDRFAGPEHAALLAEYSQCFEALRDATRRLEDITEHQRERRREALGLSELLAELERIDPQPGESESIRQDLARLEHVESLRESVAFAFGHLQSDGADVLEGVGSAARALDRVVSHDPQISVLRQQLLDIQSALADTSADLTRYADGLEVDPGELAKVQQRRADLDRLVRTQGMPLDDIIAAAPEMVRRLAELSQDESTIPALELEVSMLRDKLGLKAQVLHASRVAAGELLAGRVGTELHALAMPGAQVRIDVLTAQDYSGITVAGENVAFSATGVDEVQFLLAPHPDAPFRPITQGASGGELSRIMLGLEVVLAGGSPVGTLVFDEVDAGIGGRAAIEVGRRLAMLAASTQVIVVTHLAQVAAFSDRHLVVTKTADGSVTASSVVRVDESDRVRELARMLAGLDTSEAAAQHAQELLDLAHESKAVPPAKAAVKGRKKS